MIPYQEMPQPTDDIALTSWGAGNYFLEDRITHKTVRISPDLYWKIIDRARVLIETVEENKE